MYMRKSISVDDQLTWLECSQSSSESKMERAKVNLRRKFSLGSADKKDPLQKRLEIGKVRLALQCSHRDRVHTASQAVSEGSHPHPRPRSLSLDWSPSPRMSLQRQHPHMAHGRRLVSPPSPNAAKRLYKNLSGKFKINYTSFDETTLLGRNVKNKQCKSCLNLQGNEPVFEAVEHQDLDAVQMLLNLYTPDELDLNTPNSEGLMPLDIAIMTNNMPMAKLLLQAGARESPHFASVESRAAHLANLVQESEQRVSELSAQVVNEASSIDCAEKETQLKAWQWHHRLFKRMKTGFEHARAPDAPIQVRLSIASSSSLRVTFREPLSINSAVVTKYKVEWSTSPDFCLAAREIILDGVKTLSFTMTELVTGLPYFVRVSAYNMKGWGVPQVATPPCAAPSNWRGPDSKEAKQQVRPEALQQLLRCVRTHHQHNLCHENAKVHPPGRKPSVSKSLKHLFQPTSKFVKTLKRGLYLAAVLYKGHDVVVTHEEQVPVVDVDDSFSSSLMQDFLWFMKVSYMWEDSRWLGQCMSPVSSSCSTLLQARYKTLVAVAQLQGLLGTPDLGQLYFEPIKDKQGNVLIVTLRELNSHQSLENVRWIPLAKIQSQCKSLPAAEEPTALDMLLATLHEKLAYHRQSLKVLPPGLYLGYFKLCSSVDQIRVLVSQKHPNVLCHVKIRNNHNVSRDEWEWIQRLTGLDEAAHSDPPEDSVESVFQRELQAAVTELMKHTAIPLQQAKEFRLYSREVLEFSGGLSFLLLLPPSDEVCTVPGQDTLRSCSGLLTLPLQSFELVHYFTYDKAFIRQYCQVSALLELDLILSQQALRQAFSDSEVVAAKQRHQQVQDFIQKMEEIWREVRWIMDILQYARYRHPPGGIALSYLLDLNTDRTRDSRQSCSSGSDYLPSPIPSPETRHRLLGPQAGSPPVTHMKGSSEVFMATSSDHESKAQTPKELDLIPLSMANSGRRLSLDLQDGAPDVLRAQGPHSQLVSRDHQDASHLPLYDSDFVLPSKQLELLHITEKRQAYCVRTSSLDFPTQPFHGQRKCWSRSESLQEYPTERKTNDSGRWVSVTHIVDSTPHSGCASEAQDLTERINLTQESPEKEGQWLNSVSLSVYPQYQTGLSTATCVQVWSQEFGHFMFPNLSGKHLLVSDCLSAGTIIWYACGVYFAKRNSTHSLRTCCKRWAFPEYTHWF
ncbi:ankyrin repeat and fibronectin type-III domain-containing protein 1-like isoform X2 [Narcine bancroftii]|uniref:ankyrin repeat and fibronectin type-III domain-containing protein 1-like isoform X2 n=1 Tax=Narcine bancroftii TaxID=1343680 RepID=UPI00383101B0